MSKKLIILLTVFIDVLGIGIIIPVLPFYVESFGASAFTVTLLFAVFSFFAFFSAPLLGALSDKIGRRPVLIISIFSTAIGWLVFAAANSIFFLFLGRIIDGLAAGNFPIAQGYLLDIAKNEKEKTTNLGYIGAIFGVGLIIGPLIGGFLSAISLDFPFWFVGGLAALNFILAIRNLPETNINRDVNKKIELNPFKPLFQFFQNSKLRPGIIAWFLFGLSLASQQSTFSLYLNSEYNFNSIMVGLVTAAMGLILIFNQAFALKKIWLKYFKEEKLIIYLMLVLAIGFFFMGITYLWIFIIGILMIALAQSILRAVMTSQIAKKGDAKEQGLILGILNSVMSLSMIAGPLLAGALFGIKSNLPFLAASIFGLAAFVILLYDCRQNTCQDSTLKEDELIIEEQRVDLIS
jgi:MFS family permease